jgi:hypothetical protein
VGAWLRDLDRLLSSSPPADGLVAVAAAAGRDVAVDPDEARAVARRALLLHAAGGDARRGFDLEGRAVLAAAADLDRPERRAELVRGLAELHSQAAGLTSLEAALAALQAEPEVAWRAWACSVLLESLEDSDEDAQVSRRRDV